MTSARRIAVRMTVVAALLLTVVLPSRVAATDDQAAASLPVACPAEATSSRVFAFFLGGNRAGFQTTCVLKDGSRLLIFAFNDRGRGPFLQSRYVLDGHRVPTSVLTGGHDYLKTPIVEKFESAAGKGSWKNKVEEGERRLDGPAFYVSQTGPPGELALLARALVATPGGRLPLLPQGEARIERVGDRKVGTGDGSQTVTQYAITGLGFRTRRPRHGRRSAPWPRPASSKSRSTARSSRSSCR